MKETTERKIVRFEKEIRLRGRYKQSILTLYQNDITNVYRELGQTHLKKRVRKVKYVVKVVFIVL